MLSFSGRLIGIQEINQLQMQMKMKSSKTVTLAAATVLGLTALASNADAQGRYGRGYAQVQQASYNPYLVRQINRNVVIIGDLADEMVCRYGREVQRHRGCPCSMKLFAAMQRHAQLTETLVRASQGTCKSTFKRSACSVRTSLSGIQELRKTAKVSRQVCGLIRESCPPTTFVHENSSQWAPRPVRGGSCGTSGSYTSRGHQIPWGYLMSRFGW